jgi:hypothetical protein
MKQTLKLAGQLLLLLMAFAAAPLAGLGVANAPTPLADFELKALDGHAVRSRQLSTRDKWLLVYVEPGCRPCEEVFKVFNRETPLSDLNAKVAIVIGGRTPDEAKHIAEKYPWLPQECWYADAQRLAPAALKRRGAPVVYGIKAGNVEWSVDGSLSDPGKLESVLLTWVEE